MLSLAMIVKAATTASLFLGCATMLFFGLGTLPALFLTGFSASLLSMKARLLGERVAGAMAMVMGMMLIVKAGRYFL
jgi:sulfite exporter TauE/SafE